MADPLNYITTSVNHNGLPVYGATGSVNCNGTIEPLGPLTSGAYSNNFSLSDCPLNSTVTVTAYYGSASGSGSALVSSAYTNVYVAVVNVSPVPEFGVITGISAITLGGGAFLIIRRRHIAAHKL
jgi:hypothetical protein